MSHITEKTDGLVLRTSVALHQGLSSAMQRLADRGADRGASHATEVAGAVVLVGGIWVAVQALGLGATLSTAITTAVTSATTGGA